MVTSATTPPILTPLTPAAIFLVLTIDDGGEATVHEALTDFGHPVAALSFRVPQANLSLVAGIGSRAWDRLFSGPKPAKLHPFIALTGDRHTAPSTPGDLLLHIRGATADVCFELGSRLRGSMAGAVSIADEVHGFKYFYTHNLDAWNALSVTEQERAIGRTKLEDIEFPDADKPANAHIAVNVIKDEDGNELKIVRANMLFGTLADGDSGTYYIAYSGNPDITERMLRRMFIGEPEGNTDRVLDFSTAHTGGMFFVPTVDFLASLSLSLSLPPPPAARRGNRRIVEVSSPSGATTAAIGTGHLRDVAAPQDGVITHLREAQPLVRLRVPFTLNRTDIDDVERGAADSDWDPVKEAARTLAVVEDRAIFEGCPTASIDGIRKSSSNPALALPKDTAEFPDVIARRSASCGWAPTCPSAT